MASQDAHKGNKGPVIKGCNLLCAGTIPPELFASSLMTEIVLVSDFIPSVLQHPGSYGSCKVSLLTSCVSCTSAACSNLESPVNT